MIRTQGYRVTTALAALLMLALGLSAGAAEEQSDPAVGGRAVAIEMEAVVTDIDLDTRQVSLQGPAGDIVTLTAPEEVVKLEDVSVGDALVVSYVAALEGELREPTAEELEDPWVELTESEISDDAAHPGVGTARVVRAVVTIEGMNRLLGTVTILDARGKVHVIGDVEPEKMEGVTLGQTAVLVFAQAVALSLETQAAE
ncbi:MAG: hypothetical protein AAGA91_10890 [Pseudomonadota bacterium]